MGAFLYFIPGCPGEDEAVKLLRQLGAAHALEGVTVTRATDAGGPHGVAGVLVTSGPVEIPEGETPEFREVAGGAFHVGLVKSDPPGPADLMRASVLPGLDVELGDGNRWIVPTVRDPGGECLLPCRRRLAPDGTWKPGPVVARYADLWKRAGEVWDALTGALVGKPVTVKDADDVALAALAVNYRLAAPEVELLGLLNDSGRIAEVLKAAVGWPVIEEILSGDDDGDDAAPAAGG